MSNLQPTAARPDRRAAQFSRSQLAPPARTLIDILLASAERSPDASALDDGRTTLSYAELLVEVAGLGARLQLAGLRAGDKVGVRIPSGTNELYISILAVLYIGAAYVPVDADDPDERARLVFGEAGAAGILGARGEIAVHERVGSAAAAPRLPAPHDDAWVIFTSGSTGTPKGVAVTHRSAAAFVDAEARLFLGEEPIGPGDRVLAGLSVAFDASCEEMWLAWRYGACLVPAPRALVRAGADLGSWLVSRGVSVVSTVPTLAALWPAEALENVRLLIFGGEACPPDLGARLALGGREVWNTYGPTEATVVACAARLGGEGPVRIGQPLDGWDIAVVDRNNEPVAEGEAGELIIGGVGLARYLDPQKDAEKYAPMPTLGWGRAYRSGDLVRYEKEGLIFVGRADEQVKLGGRRVELGEVDAALQALPGVSGAAAAVHTSAGGNQILVGYLVPGHQPSLDLPGLRARLTAILPAPLIPRLTIVDSLPTKTSGKVDRAALPWPVPASSADSDDGAPALDGPSRWIADQWTAVLEAAPSGLDADFFAQGGGSLAAAQLVSAVRVRYPTITVANIYSYPRLGALIDVIKASQPDEATGPAVGVQRDVRRTSLSSQVFQTVMGIPLHVLAGMRWLTYLMFVNNLIRGWGFGGAPTVSWWWVALSWAVFVSPWGRMCIAIAAARLLLRRVEPGTYPRSGSVHLRLWLAEQISDLAAAVSLASAPWVPYYARALGAKIGRDVNLHSLPPVTGMLTLGSGCSVEPEVDLSGWWIDGDVVHIGKIFVGAEATIGARSTLMPGARIGAGAVVSPGSAVFGRVKPGRLVAGSPAERLGTARHDWPDERPGSSSRFHRLWFIGFAVASGALALIPYIAAAAAALVLLAASRGHGTLSSAWTQLLLAGPPAAVVWFGVNLLLTLGAVRVLGIGLREGFYPVRSRIGWQVWATERVLDAARDVLFPLYASLFTPTWLRLLGAKVGKNVEASTVLLLPNMTTIGEGAFLADDTMVACYELGGGYLRIAPAKIGRRSFLGNSGMTAPRRRVPRNALVAVLSAAPAKAKAGSSWIGSPPSRLRRTALGADPSRTFDPPMRLRVARAFWEFCRLVPTVLTVSVAVGVLVTLDALAIGLGYGPTALLSGMVMLLAGGVAAGATIVAKWLFVGRIRAGEHPLWSSFVWRNEVVDAFVEMVSAPWFARAASGTPALVWWLRCLGARIGHGVWCESYWLPEADLVTLGDGSTVNRGCVLQTHLFHDRIMSIDTVTLESGATMGPHGVILPAARIAVGGTVGPASLVMRGETVPGGTYWTGNPVRPWQEEEKVATP